MTMIDVPENELAVFERLLRRAIATDNAEIKRLRMLATAYWDRPAGNDSTGVELQRHQISRDLAQLLLDQLPG